MSQAIGIDLGTTFSCVAYMNGDAKVEVVENHYGQLKHTFESVYYRSNTCEKNVDSGNKITPSVVHFSSTFREVGEEAQAKRGADPLNTVFRKLLFFYKIKFGHASEIKRFMGRSASDVEIQRRPYPFEVGLFDLLNLL